MPKAVTDKSKTLRVDLKSAPPDGYVVIRKFTYGESLHRRQMATVATQSRGGGKNRGGQVQMGINFPELQFFDFAKGIVDHNLEDEEGRKLNFSNRADFDRLDSSIAIEIEEAIDSLNNLEEESEDSENPTPSKSEKPSSSG